MDKPSNLITQFETEMSKNLWTRADFLILVKTCSQTNIFYSHNSVQPLNWVLGIMVKTPARMTASHFGVPGFSPGSVLNSSSLLLCTLGDWSDSSGSCIPATSVRHLDCSQLWLGPAPAMAGIVEVNQQMGSVSQIK